MTKVVSNLLSDISKARDLIPDKKFSGSDSIFMVAPKENK